MSRVVCRQSGAYRGKLTAGMTWENPQSIYRINNVCARYALPLVGKWKLALPRQDSSLLIGAIHPSKLTLQPFSMRREGQCADGPCLTYRADGGKQRWLVWGLMSSL